MDDAGADDIGGLTLALAKWEATVIPMLLFNAKNGLEWRKHNQIAWFLLLTLSLIASIYIDWFPWELLLTFSID